MSRRTATVLAGAILSIASIATGGGCGREAMPYLGEAAPTETPKIFAPGTVSLPTAYEYGSVFSNDGLEFFYGVNVGERAEIRTMRWTPEGWSSAETVVAHERLTFGDPMLSPDERRLYFISNRPLDDAEAAAPETEPKDFDIWYVERRAEGWSDPINIGSPVNTAFHEYYVSFSASGRLYFASNRAAGERDWNFDLYSADPTPAGGFAEPVRLEGELNTPAYEADAFVAPDESYIVFASARREGLGRGDLYLSRRAADGSWSAATSLGTPFNTEGHELCPFVTSDGRYFFYTSNEEIYWVRADSVLSSSQESKTPR